MATRAQVLIPVAIAAVIIGVVGVLTIPADSKLADVKFKTGTVKLDDVTLDVQVAQTDAQKVRGLMFQNELPYNQGMIFVFDSEQVIPIWMQNMQFALDILWFDADGNVVDIEKNLPPCKSALETTMCPVQDAYGKKAKYVLEVTSGFADKYKINKDSKLEIVSI